MRNPPSAHRPRHFLLPGTPPTGMKPTSASTTPTTHFELRLLLQLQRLLLHLCKTQCVLGMSCAETETWVLGHSGTRQAFLCARGPSGRPQLTSTAKHTCPPPFPDQILLGDPSLQAHCSLLITYIRSSPNRGPHIQDLTAPAALLSQRAVRKAARC